MKTIKLALQGGGAHGAFTWGVLDRLMEDEQAAIDGISATSAGAMNGAIQITVCNSAAGSWASCQSAISIAASSIRWRQDIILLAEGLLLG